MVMEKCFKGENLVKIMNTIRPRPPLESITICDGQYSLQFGEKRYQLMVWPHSVSFPVPVIGDEVDYSAFSLQGDHSEPDNLDVMRFMIWLKAKLLAA